MIYIEKCNNEYASKEAMTLVAVSNLTKQKIQYVTFMDLINLQNNESIEENAIAAGSVKFVQQFLGKTIKPNFLPSFIRKLVKRRIWITNKWPNWTCFIKSNDKYKHFAATTSLDDRFSADEYFCSEIVEIGNEWRYYVVDGQIKCSYWYQGPEEDKPSPLLNISIPSGWYGSIDVAETHYGIEVIECHHPFALGWYGNVFESKHYYDLIVDGFRTL